jgi:hypothetical protein
MISPGKGQAPSPFVATSVVTAFVAVVAIGVTINGLAVARTDAPANFADCILDNMRNVNSDQAAKLIADSCAENFPESAPGTIKPLFAEPDDDLPPSIDAFDGYWTWRATFPNGDSCFPTRVIMPLKIEYGILESTIFLSNLGNNKIEGTVRPTGKAQFWVTSGHNLIQFNGQFSGERENDRTERQFWLSGRHLGRGPGVA